MDVENNEEKKPQYRTFGILVAGELIQGIERIEKEGADK